MQRGLREMLHKFLLGFVIASLIFLLVVAFSLCRISGYYSRMEEEEELRRMAGAKNGKDQVETVENPAN